MKRTYISRNVVRNTLRYRECITGLQPYRIVVEVKCFAAAKLNYNIVPKVYMYAKPVGLPRRDIG